ncbi:MAG: exopolysaccharide biosynthesis protein [Alphaproteobacteria bacterium]|nr:exopolysaccharide biosynthesis protein [Alphaproteobacteria bacterium]
MHQKPKKTSQIIAEIVEDCVEDGTVTVEEFLAKMGHRASALAILVFSISAVVAGIVPGFSTLVAIPILFMSLQMALGRRSIFLPKDIREKQISPKLVRGALARSIPTLRWVEKFLRPRLLFLTHPVVERVVALVVCMLAGILALPIPGGNFLPSFGISILSLAMLERDGLLILAAIGLVMLTGGVMIDLIVQTFHYVMILLNSIF